MSDLARDGSLHGISILLHSPQTEVYLTLYSVRLVSRYAYGWELDFHVQSWMCGRPFFPFSEALGQHNDREVRWQSTALSTFVQLRRMYHLSPGKTTFVQVHQHVHWLTVEEHLMYADVARTRPST